MRFLICNVKLKQLEIMITAIIKQEYNDLCSLVSNMTYEEAFKKLNGYNLTADPITIGEEKRLIGINEFFDVNYKHINTTIFRTKNNGCEVVLPFFVERAVIEIDVHLSIGTDGVELF